MVEMIQCTTILNNMKRKTNQYNNLIGCSLCWTPPHDWSTPGGGTTMWCHFSGSCIGWRWDSGSSTSWQFLSTTVSMAWPHCTSPMRGGPYLSPVFVINVCTRHPLDTSVHRWWPCLSRGRSSCVEHSAGWSHLFAVAPGIQETAKDSIVWYGTVEFNVPLDTVQVISETGALEQWCTSPIQ